MSTAMRCGFAWMLAMLGCVAGCGALVGAECRSPLERCGHVCVDLQNDRENCGTCGNACAGMAVCSSGMCRAPFDAGPDASTDAATDAARRTDAGDASIDTSVDAARPDADAGGPIDSGPLDANDLDAGPQCGLGELLCGASCVDPNDPSHCGSCTTMTPPRARNWPSAVDHIAPRPINRSFVAPACAKTKNVSAVSSNTGTLESLVAIVTT